MSADVSLPVVSANLNGYVSKAGLTYVRDKALDGDEGLFVGKAVLISDGYGDPHRGQVVGRDEPKGIWYLRYEDLG